MRGVPFDVAFSIPSDELIAWVVAMGELDGAGKFDWSDMRFVRSGEG